MKARRGSMVLLEPQPAPTLAPGQTYTRSGMLPITVVTLDTEYGALCEDTAGRSAFLSPAFFKGWALA